ncbi:SRPBCC family protein [Actinoplanes solisilvae]|uniref:SRPBCC family protein n=1 Tax=Actinoplanes solisilvae TaxID=2486853 RepID=UPI000FD88701|nr:SRPBCC family protein [Actinoplanes solisilvae]
MATRTFELTTQVEAPPEVVLDFLTSFDRHRGLHPYLVSATVVDEGTGGEGPWRDWRVVERPRLGPIRYTIRFAARVTRTSDMSFRTDTGAGPGVLLAVAMTVTPNDQGTLVRETTTVTAPGPLIGYVTRQARAAHARVFRLLPAEVAR